MKRFAVWGLGVGLVLATAVWVTSAADKADKADSMLSHDVFFTLKDSAPAERQKLVEACKKYLSDHPGTVSFSAGTLADDLNREVNDRDFHVALHILFKDKASHDKYAVADTHLKFIAENKDNWTKVRVFDSYVSGTKK
jgi:hypothetical protein